MPIATAKTPAEVLNFFKGLVSKSRCPGWPSRGRRDSDLSHTLNLEKVERARAGIMICQCTDLKESSSLTGRQAVKFTVQVMVTVILVPSAATAA